MVAAMLFLRAGGNTFVVDTAVSLMRLNGVHGASVLALGAAYAFANILGCLILAIHFEYRHRGFFARVSRTFWESLGAAMFGLLGAYLMLEVVGPLDTGSTTLSVFLKGLAGGMTGLIVCALAYWVVGSREFHETWAAMHGRYLKRIWPYEMIVSLVGSAEENTPGAA